jgi:hypothetical protein
MKFTKYDGTILVPSLKTSIMHYTKVHFEVKLYSKKHGTELCSGWLMIRSLASLTTVQIKNKIKNLHRIDIVSNTHDISVDVIDIKNIPEQTYNEALENNTLSFLNFQKF